MSTETFQDRVRSGVRSANEWLIVGGVALIGLCVICTLLEVQTSEAAIRNAGAVDTLIAPDLSTFNQLWNLFTGKLSPFETVVAIWGWGSQIIYFACIVGYNHFHRALARHNKFLAGLCVVVAVGITLYNCVTDYNYVGMVLHNFWWQVAISAVIALGAASGGIAGIHFIKAAFGRE